MRKYTFQLFIIGFAITFFISCGTDKQTSPTKDTEIVEITIPEFNADSAYHFIAQQIEFGPRVPGSKSSVECADYLSSTLERFGADVIIQKASVRAYNGKILPMQNIIASWNLENKKRVMLCSHWDSRPYADYDPDANKHRTPIDGANDGASGVGVLLEIARHLANLQANIGVDIILFDVEDYGEPKDDQSKIKDDNWGLGSQYWSRNPHKHNYVARYGILLDMVGAENATFYHEGYSNMYAKHVLNKVWNIAEKLGYSSYFINQSSNYITDDHYYVNTILGLPTIDIIHQDKNSPTGFFPYWHTVEDTLDKISKETLKAVGETLITVVYSEQ